MSTVRVVSAPCGRVMGSETARLPGGMRIEDSPSKVSGVIVEGMMVEVPRVLFRGRAMVTVVMGRSVVPKALERRRRMVVAGWVRRRVWRSVVLGKMAGVEFY